ncbi:Fur family transcriptional regulator, zinc uptake regulator [Pelosinus fermentans]|jgi:Fe2+ or Zn2+ uptake regulation protein|uniref:Ferric-uptake regulator n=1 Tax=Pelosinus fermentans B4 TaxID=1149862 RepID=I8RJD8_9FIRM|nr:MULTISPECIES: transcriptional repressor [Pelosinus]EIW20123.1 ferric-uptake regulator [Pelosinus fermentans B4]OAM93071.1 ferric uptake regulator, Fur family [Pelosinus fermentans DSM 17108]SDQ66061.1 Fur family transcriptional regulator, zinc uptake regulator [Pelosinus fermentans]
MEKFITLLREKGYKITPQRRAVITAFMNCDRFATAQQILDHVKQLYPDVSLDTVYRNLTLLVNLGIICEIHTPGKDSNIYELITTAHHHHLVCLECGKTECLDFCPVTKESFDLIGKKHFKIISHSLEFYGYCASCHTQ